MKDKSFKIRSDFKNANVPRTVRFPEDMFEELNTIAVQNCISLNYLILQCCRYAIDNLEISEDKKD